MRHECATLFAEHFCWNTKRQGANDVARAPRRDRAGVCAYDACVLAIGRAAGRARRPGAASRARIVRARVLRGDTWTAGPQIHVGARAMGCRAGRRRFYAREA